MSVGEGAQKTLRDAVVSRRLRMADVAAVGTGRVYEEQVSIWQQVRTDGRIRVVKTDG